MIKSIVQKFNRRKYRKHRLQSVKTAPGLNLVTIGSDYGAWTFHDDGQLQGSTIVSAGLGEDASFDVEFARKFGARVIIADPTPRAVAHFEELKERLGMSREQGYAEGGCQPVEAYDLEDVKEGQLHLEPVALWIEHTNLRFYQPASPEHVSHSIVNFQNDYRTDTDFITVEACTMRELLEQNKLDPNDVALLKMDIEGAEVEVLQQLLADGLRPRQICVEYDELNVPCKIAFERVDKADAALCAAGYRCVYGNGTTDYLYLLS